VTVLFRTLSLCITFTVAAGVAIHPAVMEITREKGGGGVRVRVAVMVTRQAGIGMCA
jgi:hypothetical protein